MPATVRFRFWNLSVPSVLLAVCWPVLFPPLPLGLAPEFEAPGGDFFCQLVERQGVRVRFVVFPVLSGFRFSSNLKLT